MTASLVRNFKHCNFSPKGHVLRSQKEARLCGRRVKDKPSVD